LQYQFAKLFPSAAKALLAQTELSGWLYNGCVATRLLCCS